MLTEKRRRIILDLLEKEDTVHLRDLMEALGASESTVRRDLSILEEEGTLIRVHGGAKRVYSKEYEPTTKEKERSNRREKECSFSCDKRRNNLHGCGNDNASYDSAFRRKGCHCHYKRRATSTLISRLWH